MRKKPSHLFTKSLLLPICIMLTISFLNVAKDSINAQKRWAKLAQNSSVGPESLPGNDFYSASIDKHYRLSTLKSPKLILVGGSNLAFGIDSKKLEGATGYPVVNMGLSAGLGLLFMLNEIKTNINRGDVIVLVPEYHLFISPRVNPDASVSAQALLQDYPDAHQWFFESDSFTSVTNVMVLTEIKNAITSINIDRFPYSNFTLLFATPNHPENINTSLGKDLNEANSVYSRNGFNLYGDVVSHLAYPPKTDSEILLQGKWGEFNQQNDSIKILNAFSNFARGKGAIVLFAYPSVSFEGFTNNFSQIRDLQKSISENLKIKVLGEPRDFSFPTNLFYDTVYHLNAQGRELRTVKLAELIKNTMK